MESLTNTVSKNQLTEISIIYEIKPKVGQFFDDRVHRQKMHTTQHRNMRMNKPAKNGQKTAIYRRKDHGPAR